MPLAAASALTVVPWRTAISLSVSPAFTTTAPCAAAAAQSKATNAATMTCKIRIQRSPEIADGGEFRPICRLL
jgi:hypothetical protein